MPEHHKLLLAAVGVPEDQITAFEGLTAEQLKEWKPDALATTIRGLVKTGLSNDAEFLASIPKEKISPTILKEIEKGQYARFQNELEEVAINKLGLDKKDLTDEDKKSIKGYVEKLATTYLAKKGTTEGLQKMQSDLQEARASLDTLKTEHTLNLTKELEKVNGLHTGKLIKTLARVELQSLEGIKLSVGAAYITDPILSALQSEYSIVLDEQDNLVLKQKSDSKLDVIDSKGKKVTFPEALKAAVLKNKLGIEEKADDPKDPKNNKKKIIVKPGDGDDGDGTELVPSYISDKIAGNKDV